MDEQFRAAFACTAYDCGFSVQKHVPGYRETVEAHAACVENGQGSCAVRGDGEGCLVKADPNTNVLYPNGEIPAIRYRVEAGETVIETEIVTRTV